MKFTIRDLFLVTVIVGVCLAWWVDRQNLARWGYKMERERDRAVFKFELQKDFPDGVPDLPSSPLAPASNPPKK